MTKLIVLTGRAGSGKSTAADCLRATHGFQVIKFSAVLKRMMRVLGLTERQIEGDQKELPCDLLGGKTPRYAMQTLGTEWGRDTITRDLWVNAWREKVLWAFNQKYPVVCDDCRFDNELDMARRLGAEVYLIHRLPEHLIVDAAHPSEHVPQEYDDIIMNSGSIADLEKTMRVIAQRCIGAPA